MRIHHLLYAIPIIFIATVSIPTYDPAKADHPPKAKPNDNNPVLTRFSVDADRSQWKESNWSHQLATDMGGVAEYTLPDKTRVDILTNDVAWEVDWGHKWAEGIGQSLYYGLATDRRPGLILLLRDGEQRFYLRALVVCAKHNIKLKVQDVPKSEQP